MTEKIDTLIVGAGLTGLTIAHTLRRQDPDHKLLLFDKSKSVGGVIKSHHENGFISEIGPHGFLDNCPESKEILQATNLDQESVKAPLIDFVRYVFLHNKLNMIEQTPLKIAKAPLISWPSKFRVLADLWKKPLPGEPTIAEWVEHRFGPAMLPYMDAAFTGTYAGDIERLSVDGVMPGVRAIEKESGSLLRGLLKKMFQAKRKGSKKKLNMPAMTSFANGMERLPQRLAEDFQQELLLDNEVVTIARCPKGWQIELANGSSYQAENLALALPTNQALKLLEPLNCGTPCSAIPEAWIASVIFGFAGESLPPGFGFLTPEVEKRFSLGCLFSSNMFPGRAPKGEIVMETLVGGRRHPERVELDDETLIKNALADMKEILGFTSEPVYTRVLRSHSPIPQLEKGYPELIRWKEALELTSPGLHIAGFGWGGIGLNDMMKSGTKIGKAIINKQREKEKPEAKGIYF